MRSIETVTLDDARRVIAAGEDEAARQGQPVNIAVVDVGGVLVAHIRQDQAWIGSVDVAINKAFSARAFDVSTEGLSENAQPGGQFYGIQDSNHGRVMIFAGGVPLMSGDAVVGAVGVSGGTGEQDQAVATAAAAALSGEHPGLRGVDWVPRTGGTAMPTPDVPLEKLGFLTLGLFDGDDPGPGWRARWRSSSSASSSGFDSAYLRHRHFQTGISSPIAIMAAASQRTTRIAMGTAVTRWAGRTRCGWPRTSRPSTSCPAGAGARLQRRPADPLGRRQGALYPDTADVEDLSTSASRGCCGWCAASR